MQQSRGGLDITQLYLVQLLCRSNCGAIFSALVVVTKNIKTYSSSLLQIIHTLEKSEKLSFDDKCRLEKQIKRLNHFLDIKEIRKAKVQVELVSSLILEVLKK